MSDRTFLLQDWVTIRGGALAATAAVVQSQERWLDLPSFADGAFWIDVAEVTPPGGVSSNYLQLLLETAPTCDDIASPSPITQSWFQPATGTIRLGTAAQFIQASATPFVASSVKSASSVSLSRYLRWRIVPSTTGAWDLTFRIRAVANRSGFFAPTDISGCVLWLRSDLGVALGTGQAMSSWGDQSGSGNNASAGSTTPNYNPSGGVNNLPRVTGATNAYMTGSFSGSGNVQAHTLFSVVTYPGSLANNAAFAGTISSAVNSGFAQFMEAPSTGIVGRAGAGPGQFASAVTTDATSLGSVGIYSTAASSSGTVDLYVNGGASKASASTSFTLANASDYVLFALSVPVQYVFTGDAYEHILFNRVLTAAERTRVHRYLGGRYGIAVP